MQAPAQLVALSAKEQEKSGATKTLTEEELNKYLDQLPTAPDPSQANRRRLSPMVAASVTPLTPHHAFDPPQ